LEQLCCLAFSCLGSQFGMPAHSQKESLQFGTESADLVPRQTLVLEAHGTETTSVGCMHPHPSLFLLLLLRGTERDDKGRNLKGRGSQGLEVVSCVNERKD